MMNNEIILYNTTPNLVQIPTNIFNPSDILKFNRALTRPQTEKLRRALENELLDMAAEYMWSRTIELLRESISKFGLEFVSEMLDRPELGNINEVSEYEIISLSADLGFINKTAKMEFIHTSELIKHYQSREASEELPATKAVDIVRLCIQHVLSFSDTSFDGSFTTFRSSLSIEPITKESQLYQNLMTSPYFYKRTIVKTLVNLSKTIKNSAERENVFNNMNLIISSIWSDLSSEDKWFVGRSYAQANNDGDKMLAKSLMALLLKIKGFDFVPENLRSNSYLKVAKQLLTVHFGIDNYYNEPPVAQTLSNMGTSIPTPAFSQCMTAILACKIGNFYGISNAAQPYLNAILNNISIDRWSFYFTEILPKDETILYKLTQSRPYAKFEELISTYNLLSNTSLTPEAQNVIAILTTNKNYKVWVNQKMDELRR